MNQYEAQLCAIVVICVTLVIKWVIAYLRDTEPVHPLDRIGRPPEWPWPGPEER